MSTHTNHHGSVTLKCILVALSELPPYIFKGVSWFGCPAALSWAAHPPFTDETQPALLPPANTTWKETASSHISVLIHDLMYEHVGLSMLNTNYYSMLQAQPYFSPINTAS